MSHYGKLGNYGSHEQFAQYANLKAYAGRQEDYAENYAQEYRGASGHNGFATLKGYNKEHFEHDENFDAPEFYVDELEPEFYDEYNRLPEYFEQQEFDLPEYFEQQEFDLPENYSEYFKNVGRGMLAVGTGGASEIARAASKKGGLKKIARGMAAIGTLGGSELHIAALKLAKSKDGLKKIARALAAAGSLGEDHPLPLPAPPLPAPPQPAPPLPLPAPPQVHLAAGKALGLGKRRAHKKENFGLSLEDQQAFDADAAEYYEDREFDLSENFEQLGFFGQQPSQFPAPQAARVSNGPFVVPAYSSKINLTYAR